MNKDELPDDATVTLTVKQLRYICEQHFIDDLERNGPIARAFARVFGLKRRT